MKVGLEDGTSQDEVVVAGSSVQVDAAEAPAIPNMGFNGATWDRQRNNTQGALLASAARTSGPASANQTNHNAIGAIFTLDITANPGGTETLALSVRGIDPVSGSPSNLVVFPATAAAANNRYQYIVYPGAVETIANSLVEVQGLPIPRTFAVIVAHSGAGSWTYSLSYALIL